MNFRFAINLSDIDLWDIDMLDTDLDLLDTDIPSKHFVCLQNVLKTSSAKQLLSQSRHLFPCFLEVWLSCSISYKLQEKVLPKKTFLIHTETVSWKECGISKQGLYLKAVCLRNCRVNKCLTILTRIVMTPDGIYDTYVHFNDDLGLDIDTYNLLIWKVNC